MTRDEFIKALQESEIAGDDKITYIKLTHDSNTITFMVDRGYLEEFSLMV